VVVEHLTDLQRFYGRQLNDTQIAFYAKELGTIDDMILTCAIRECIRSERYFPTTKVLSSYISQARQSAWQQKKDTDPIELPPQRSSDREHARESFKLLHLVLPTRYGPPKLQGPALLSEMRFMGKTWPGLGWEQCAREFETFLQRKSQPRS